MSQANPISLDRPRQRWLMGLRAFTSLFLCAALILIQARELGRGRNLDWFRPGLAAVGIYLILAVLFYALRPAGRAALFQAAAQVAADLALAISLTLITGVEAGPFSFLFLIAIINSAFLGGLSVPLTVATFSAALWGGLMTLQNVRFLAGLMFMDLGSASFDSAVPLAWDAILSVQLDHIIVNTGACYLVAVLSGRLAGQLASSRRALLSSQARLKRLTSLNEIIVQSVGAGLVTANQEGLILTVNRSGLRMLGLNLEDMVGRPYSLFWPKAADALLRAGDGAETGDFRFRWGNGGREMILELHALTLTNVAGEPWGSLFVIKDLTSLIRMEETMRRAERLASLGEMAAGLAHELRTPLASLTGAWHMLARDAPDPADQKRLTGIIGREMDRLTRLTNDFLSFARPARSQPDFFDLSAQVEDQLRLFAGALKPGLSLETRLEPAPAVFFDRDHFAQIAWNLLNNAVEAGARREKISLAVETGRDPAWPDHVAFKVANDGPPIPPEDLPRLFEPFFTTKPAGHGLGLATVSRLLHEGGGHITVRSVPDELTVFTVFLPVAPPPGSQPGPPA